MTGCVGQVRREDRDTIDYDELTERRQQGFAEKMLQFTLLDSLVSVLSLFLCLPSARHAISRTRNDHKSPKEASGLHAKTPQRKVAMEMPKSREE